MITDAAVLLRSRWEAIAVSTLVFTMLCAVGSAYVERRTDAIETEVSTALSMTREEFTNEAQRQVIQLGTLEMQSFVKTFEERTGPPTISAGVAVTRDKIGVIYVSRIAPLVFGLLAIELLLAFIAAVLFVIVLAPRKDAGSDIVMLLKKLIPSIGLVFWMMFRSLLWIPFVGPLLAIFYGPRLVLAPVFLLTGEAGVFGSVRLSLKRTMGQWSSILLRMIGIFLVCFLLLWFVLVPISIVTLFSFKIGYFLWLWALFGAVAFLCSCLVALARSF